MTTRNEEFVDYSTIQEHIRRARIERSVAVANMIAHGVEAAWRGLKGLGNAIAATLTAASDARSVEAQAFLHRPSHR